METRELRKRLRKLSAAAQGRFPHLNYGGCCVFAAAVAKELEKHGIQYEVMVTGSKSRNIGEIRPPKNTVDAWNGVGVDFGHVGVRMRLRGRWYTYDSEAFLRHKHRFGFRYVDTYGGGTVRWESSAGGITAKEAKELADEPRWNRQFWSPENVRAVRSMVRKAFQ